MTSKKIDYAVLDALKIKSIEKERCFELQISHTFEVEEKVDGVTVWCLIE